MYVMYQVRMRMLCPCVCTRKVESLRLTATQLLDRLQLALLLIHLITIPLTLQRLSAGQVSTQLALTFNVKHNAYRH